MGLIIKLDIMIKCINGTDLKNVDLSNKGNFMKPKDLNVGIADLRKKRSGEEKTNCWFFSDIITFLVSLIEVRFPIQLCVMLKYLTGKKWFLLMVSCCKVKWLFQHFVKLGILDNTSCDKALDQFIHFIQNE